IAQGVNEDVNAALMRHGFIAGTPVRPTLAFSVDVLQLALCLRRNAPGVGVQGLVKSLCSLLCIQYKHGMEALFSNAFDIFLDITTQVDRMTDKALERHKPNWYRLYGCPPCGFKARNSLPACLNKLKPTHSSRTTRCDSYKRGRTAGKADDREYESDLWLSRDVVNDYRDVVRSPLAASRDGTTTTENDQPERKFILRDDGFVVEEDDRCGETWTAANGKELTPATKEVFDQTGMFACVCRHGCVEFAVEMVQSGELAKYGLAIVSKILDVYGAHQALGYDINCVFNKTVANSSLGSRARELGMHFVVDAFHCWAHKRKCQLDFHPLYKPSEYGLEDLSTCERLFSSLNRSAKSVRHASSFRWKQILDIHIRQINADRYASLGNFILNNYKQALSNIYDLEREITIFEQQTGLSRRGFPGWLEEEHQFLATATKAEPVAQTLRVSYVECLEKVASILYVFHKSLRTSLDNTRSADFDRLQDRADAAVADVERLLGIDPASRWSADSENYKTTLKYINNKQFVRCAEEIQGLVVSRLMELDKMNLTSTGYKLRKHISQALTRRCVSLRSAIDRYNKLAPLQSPKRDLLVYSEIVEKCSLSDFDILKSSDHNLLSKPWAIPINRLAVNKFYKLEGSKEEVRRCNREIRRLAAWVEHDDCIMAEAVLSHSETDPAFASHLDTVRAERLLINNQLRHRLWQISCLTGYTG
ncbi:hypothetical protein K488DRAFT_8790, partial [Vararia minispora EC-137]